MEEKLIRVKENIVLGKAEAFDHILSKFDKNAQVTKEDLFEILNPIKKLLKDIEFTKYAQLVRNSSGGQFLDIDDLGYQEIEISFIFTELYYRLKPINSIILYDQPGWLDNETKTRISTLLREVGDNNQIWITSYPTRMNHSVYSGVLIFIISQ